MYLSYPKEDGLKRFFIIISVGLILFFGCSRKDVKYPEKMSNMPPKTAIHSSEFDNKEALLLEKYFHNPYDIGIIDSLCDLYLEGKEYPRMTYFLERDIEINPDSPVSMVNLGCSYFRLGKYKEAKHYISKAIEKDPDNPLIIEGMVVLARTYIGLGDNKKALDLFKKINLKLAETGIKEKDKKLIFGMIVFGVSQDLLGKSINPVSSEEEIMAKLQKSPDDPDLYLSLVEYRLSKSDLEGARESMEKALEILGKSSILSPPGTKPKSDKYI